MTHTEKNIHEGSCFDDFLKEENILDDATAVAVKRVLAWQVMQAMAQENVTKTAMAKRMKTSRSQLERLLDADYTGTSLEVMQRAASTVGRKLRITLE